MNSYQIHALETYLSPKLISSSRQLPQQHPKTVIDLSTQTNCLEILNSTPRSLIKLENGELLSSSMDMLMDLATVVEPQKMEGRDLMEVATLYLSQRDILFN